MTYAIIETGGKQLRVEPGRFYDVERLAVEVDERVLINQVLFVGSDDDISIGQPFVEGAVVEATVLRHLRGRKIIVYKMKPKKKTRKKRGHRQELTRLMINGISLNGDTIASVETTQVAAPVENIAVAATDDAATVADVAIAATDAVSEPLEDAPAVVEVEAPAEAEVSQAEVVVAETPIIEVAASSAEAVDDEPVDAEASVVEVLADQDEASTATEESEVAIEDEAITDEAITDEAITGDDTDSAVEDETAEAEDDEMDEVADEA